MKTTIITPFGLFLYIRTPFGLRNTGQTFQRFMDGVVRGLEGVFVYVDDILVASKNEKNHEHHLSALFTRLKLFGRVISPEKSTFGVNQVDFLGYPLSAAGLSPMPSRVEAIRQFAIPDQQEIPATILRNGELLSLVHTKLRRDHVSLIRPAKEGY